MGITGWIILAVVGAAVLFFVIPTFIMSLALYRVLLVRTKPEKWGRECSMPEDVEYRGMFEDGVAWREKYRDSRHRKQIYIEKLKGLSPLEKLGQGYSYTADVHGRKITQTGQVKKGDTICVYVSDGRLQAKVTDIQKDKQDAGEV